MGLYDEGKEEPWHEDPFGWIKRKLKGAKNPLAESDADRLKRENLNLQGASASAFADRGEAEYGKLGVEAQAQRDELRARAAGKNSMSGEMLRQGLQQQYGQQRSMAAGASPQNQAMAARTAANNMGRASTGMSGQAAMAGLQERKDASDQLSGMINAGRGQEMGVALGSRGNANAAYGAGAGDKSAVEKYGPAVVGLLGTLMSDKRTKTEIGDGDSQARAILDGLKAYSYRYRDEDNGKGRQVGVLAQDLERTPLKQAVINTPRGKMVDGAKLAGGIAATLPGIDQRIAKLEQNAAQPKITAEQLRAAVSRGDKTLGINPSNPPNAWDERLREALRRRTQQASASR